MPRIWLRIFGVLLIAPWFIIPRCAPSKHNPRPAHAAESVSAFAADELVARDREVSAGESGAASHAWRRTVHGWERSDAWAWRPPQQQPALVHSVHPWTIAVLQALLCLGALVALDRGSKSPPATPASSRLRSRARVRRRGERRSSGR